MPNVSGNFRGRKVSPIFRFLSYLNMNEDQGPDACWTLDVAHDRDGYPQFRVGGKQSSATRFLWEWITGDRLLTHEFMCHKCDNPACVKFTHLFKGTALDNNRDCIRKGRRQRCASS